MGCVWVVVLTDGSYSRAVAMPEQPAEAFQVGRSILSKLMVARLLNCTFCLTRQSVSQIGVQDKLSSTVEKPPGPPSGVIAEARHMFKRTSMASTCPADGRQPQASVDADAPGQAAHNAPARVRRARFPAAGRDGGGHHGAESRLTRRCIISTVCGGWWSAVTAAHSRRLWASLSSMG